MRKIVKAAAALAMGCVLLSTSAFAAMVDNINEVGYLDDGVFTVELTELGEGESTIIVLPEGVALENADERNILYINQKTIKDGAASYTINLGAEFDGVAKVYAGGTNMSAAELGTLKAPIPVQSVTLNAVKTELEIGETATITVAVLPEEATYKTVTWSENVTAAEDGLSATFTATEAGTYKVTATTVEGVVGEIEIVVKPAVVSVTDLTLTADKTELEIGETATITAEVIPADATDKTVTWSNNVAADGTTATFTATEAGTFTVTATAGGITKEVVITVKEKEPEIIPVTGLALEVADDELEIGETTTITATVTPDDATDKTVTWSDNVEADGLTATFTAPEVAEDTVYTITATAGDITEEVTITVKAAVVSSVIKGDVVGSIAGEINLDDAAAVLQMALSAGTWTADQIAAADVVGTIDGEVNLDDAAAVLQKALSVDVIFKD